MLEFLETLGLDSSAWQAFVADLKIVMGDAPGYAELVATPSNAGLIVFGVFIALARGYFMIAVAVAAASMGLAEHLGIYIAPEYFDAFVAAGFVLGAIHLLLVAFLGPEGGGASFASLIAAAAVAFVLLPFRTVRRLFSIKLIGKRRSDDV